MTTNERCWIAFRAFLRTTLDSLRAGTVLTAIGVGVLFAISCTLGLLGGPLVIAVAVYAGFFAFMGFLGVEVFLVLPLALLLGTCSAVEAYIDSPRIQARFRSPARAHRCRPVAKARCPVCATALAHDVVACARCETPHHRECWKYEGKCAIYGCS